MVLPKWYDVKQAFGSSVEDITIAFACAESAQGPESYPKTHTDKDEMNHNCSDVLYIDINYYERK